MVARRERKRRSRRVRCGRERAHAEPSMAGVGDYLALLKPRVMSLVVFTALVGLVVAPGHVHPVLGVHRAALHRGRRRRRRRAQHVVRRRHRRGDDAHRATARFRPAASQPGEALAFGLTLAVGSVVVLGLMVNLLAAGAARLHDLLLRRRLHDVAQALDAAEHRDRRRGRRVSADDRLGGGDRRHRHRVDPAVPHHLLLDAAAFLGAVALRSRGIRPRRRADAAGGRGRAPRPAGRSCSIRWCWRRSARRPGCSGYAGLAYGVDRDRSAAR